MPVPFYHRRHYPALSPHACNASKRIMITHSPSLWSPVIPPTTTPLLHRHLGEDVTRERRLRRKRKRDIKITHPPDPSNAAHSTQLDATQRTRPTTPDPTNSVRPSVRSPSLPVLRKPSRYLHRCPRCPSMPIFPHAHAMPCKTTKCPQPQNRTGVYVKVYVCVTTVKSAPSHAMPR
jgi:hypothetical protein